jgi:hypothetical protein
MAKVQIIPSLFKEIKYKFGGEAHKVLDLLETLEENPKKGKVVGVVGKIIIKELKYKSFRFYFITDGFKIKVLDLNELKSLIIKFVRMSNKKNQQKIINEIKDVLRDLGIGGF